MGNPKSTRRTFFGCWINSVYSLYTHEVERIAYDERKDMLEEVRLLRAIISKLAKS